MSLNGWYKQTLMTNLGLYQFDNDVQKVNIIKNTINGLYSGSRLVNGMWVKYSTQEEMNTIWNAQYNGATPLPGNVQMKK